MDVFVFTAVFSALAFRANDPEVIMSTLSLSRDINILTKEKVQQKSQPINPLYNAWAEIDLGCIKHNVATIRRWIGGDVKLLAVIKADAYGHGINEISRTVLASGAEWLGVTSIAEALELRKLHPSARILILSAGMYDHSKLIVKHNLTPIVSSRQMAALLNEAGEYYGKVVKVHLKIDTGMGRLGIWHEHAIDFIKYSAGLPFIQVEGICSHFSSVSSSALDMEFTREQLGNFENVVESAARLGIYIPIRHIGNSGAVMLMREAHLDLVRAGISVYGLVPSSEFKTLLPLKPALSLKSRVAYLKDVFPGRAISYGRTFKIQEKTRIATIPIGYSNGYARSLSNKGQVLVRGQRASVVGIVTMDQIMVDVGKIPNVNVGDEVVLIGEQGNDRITATEVAKWAGTISYEILCKLNVPRVYFPTEESAEKEEKWLNAMP
jgi:alanine racemase